MKPTIIAILCVGFFSTLSFVNFNEKRPEEAFSRKANLALRQVGHQLLQLAGDERSAIPPIQMAGPNEFTLKLGMPFNYDTLPQLLNEALLAYNIRRDYEVVVRRCNDNLPILGYNRMAFDEGEVPCVGREQLPECNNITLIFTASSGPVTGIQAKRFSLFFLILLAIAGIGFFWKKNKTTAGSSSLSGSAISLGNFTFDHRNQTLQAGRQQRQLTFRESKLLYFLASNANEVITRDTLIAEVWGDEGVIVGRSLDVFISRLRKLLKEDEAVMIKTIHGVGYRLEVENHGRRLA
ncbi:MAG: winged helix-turn-helix transcriptional regulator [Phaeodactylibacter sp.]|nr:winged helix-turn-helix transcriptional regulator [Phaeodactylibacter sp.]